MRGWSINENKNKIHKRRGPAVGNGNWIPEIKRIYQPTRPLYICWMLFACMPLECRKGLWSHKAFADDSMCRCVCVWEVEARTRVLDGHHDTVRQYICFVQNAGRIGWWFPQTRHYSLLNLSWWLMFLLLSISFYVYFKLYACDALRLFNVYVERILSKANQHLEIIKCV